MPEEAMEMLPATSLVIEACFAMAAMVAAMDPFGDYGAVVRQEGAHPPARVDGSRKVPKPARAVRTAATT